jgi:ubiquitin
MNSCNFNSKRTGGQIKAKWQDLKYRTNKNDAEISAKRLKTGGELIK